MVPPYVHFPNKNTDVKTTVSILVLFFLCSLSVSDLSGPADFSDGSVAYIITMSLVKVYTLVLCRWLILPVMQFFSFLTSHF